MEAEYLMKVMTSAYLGADQDHRCHRFADATAPGCQGFYSLVRYLRVKR
jgi:hypothetical protein